MKKLLNLLLVAVMALTLVFSLSACNRDYDGEINVYVVDGAPALAFSKLMHEENKLGKESVSYNVIKSPSPSDASENISTVVANKKATVALLPINLAVKLAGTGKDYKLLSVNTHGNLYGLSKNYEFTSLNDLKGKKVGVIQMANVPGLTFKAILNNASVAFTENESELTADKVFLKNIEPAQIGQLLTSGTIDFAVSAEPQVSTLTTNAPAIKKVFSLQNLWGDTSYPQAVVLVKSELAKDEEFCDALLTALDESATWVKTNGATAFDAISAHCVEGYSTSLNKNTLTESAIIGCNIKSVSASKMKETIVDYMNKINAVGTSSFGTPSDKFFA